MTSSEIRQELRERLPSSAFRPHAYRGLFFVPVVAMIFIAAYAAARPETPWYLALAASVVIGNAYAMLVFLGHEALHGAITRNAALKAVYGFLGFTPFLISPHLWHVWHNVVHHGKTNHGNRDPDGFGTLAVYKRLPISRRLTALGPGSARWPSVFFLFYWFTFHGQVVLWFHRKGKEFERLNVARAYAEFTAQLALWVIVGLLLGMKGALYAIVLPMLVGNFILMSYIATNHFLRPQTRENDPIDNSMSVTTFGWVDSIHFNFSHHIEHHLFPGVSGKFAPQMRRHLKDMVGARYVSPPHWLAVRELYRTPRIYKDAYTLIDPVTGKTACLKEIEERFGNAPAKPLRPQPR